MLLFYLFILIHPKFNYDPFICKWQASVVMHPDSTGNFMIKDTNTIMGFTDSGLVFRPDVLKTALVKAVEKGHLEQITGKGARGTFQVNTRTTRSLSNCSKFSNTCHVVWMHLDSGAKLFFLCPFTKSTYFLGYHAVVLKNIFGTSSAWNIAWTHFGLELRLSAWASPFNVLWGCFSER